MKNNFFKLFIFKFKKSLFWRYNKNNWEIQILNKNFYLLWIATLIALVLTITYFSFSQHNINAYTNKKFLFYINEIFKFNQKSTLFNNNNLWIYSFKTLLNTVKITISATFLGFVFAIISSFFGAKKINNNLLCKLWRFIIIVLRAFPVLVFATIFKKSLDPIESLFWIYVWFTWLWIHKYLIDMINSFDLSNYYLSIKLGENKYKAFYKEVLVKIKTRIFSLYFYSLESNFRWISLLGTLGIYGLGLLIYKPINIEINQNISQLTIPLLIFMFFLIINEIISFLINYFLFEKQYKFSKKTKIYSLKYNFRFLFTIVFFIITFIIFILALIDLEKNYSKMFLWKSFFARIFQINFEKIFSFNKISPLVLLFKVIWQSFIITFYVAIFGTFLGIVQSQKINNKFQSVVLKILAVFVRTMPLIVLFYIFDIFWINPFTTFFLLMIFLNSFSFSKIVSTMVDKIEIDFFNNLKKQGYSQLKIIFIFIIPFIKKELFIQIIFMFENVTRSVITYGIILNGANLGSQIKIFTEKEQFANAANYLFPTMLLFIFLELFLSRIKTKNKKNYLKMVKQLIIFK
ncbi:hypothetical protein [Mesomycoplasma neurolyticum]|uniref:ABC-type phosphate/phosphonate transport system, permease component n=1 Tax=Mesomycoplasma neurolyticum TaxID=2120 RepID=A0A449A547_9BACT|nr:hypothetical protein [Mesomycoplasma neurolyticum]VEU59357.1 ABC-type phosphate/phosphonate transport system, permease component [Mesomycoplasma neurolyticum]